MCYDLKVALERQLKVARQFADPEIISELEERILPLLDPNEQSFSRVSGFDHPSLLLLKNKNKLIIPEFAQWGLVPSFVKDPDLVNEYRNKTLNCRVETMTDKPSYKESILSGRSMLSIDGFYEHHHRFGKSFPYFISDETNEDLLLASISNDTSPFTDSITGSSTFTIVTTRAIGIMKEIHNNPKLKEARMPLLVRSQYVQDWLNVSLNEKELNELVEELKMDLRHIVLKAHTVKPFSRKQGLKEDPLANKFFPYPELQKGLFD